MEAGKAHSLLAAIWRPRKADGIWVWRSENQETDGISPGWGQEETGTPAQIGRERESSLSLPFCAIQAFHGLEEAHPHWGEICFTQSNLIWKFPHRHTQKWCSPTSGHPMIRHIDNKMSCCSVSGSPLSLTSHCWSMSLDGGWGSIRHRAALDQVHGRALKALYRIEDAVLGFVLLGWEFYAMITV